MKKAFYLIKIEMVEVLPTVWRKFVIPSDISLDRLHDVIQVVMGWTDSHLHEFNFGNQRYVETPDEEFDDEMTDIEGSVRLNRHFKKKGDSCIYVYDFGDSWMHKLTLENANYKLDEHESEIWCLDGKGACPPEDVGGPPGYEEFCEIIKNPRRSNHKEMVAWSSHIQPQFKKFDPEHFDQYSVNDLLGWYIRWARPRKLSI